MSHDPGEGFRVTDRRRRDDDAATPPPTPLGAPLGAAEPQPAPGDEESLQGLFMMLATEALIALGDTPDPATGERHVDPPAAAEVIDLLLLLRRKTEGNRTAAETQLLDELIYDLQLGYVRVTASAG